jgi:hypothetical protein
VLIDTGADIEAMSAPGSGGVPNGTALQHAAVFGMTDVVDVLVAAGPRFTAWRWPPPRVASPAGRCTGSRGRAGSEPSHAELLEEAGRARCLRVPDQAGEAQPNRPRTGPEAA